MIFAENQRGLVSRTGTGNHIHSSYWIQNIFTSALLRINCPRCFEVDSSKCSNTIGMQYGVATMSGESFIPKSPTSYDVICNSPAVFGSYFLRNSVFHNFRDTYSTGFEDCGDNYGL